MSRSVVGRDSEGRVTDIEVSSSSGPIGGGSGGSGEQGSPGPPGNDGADGADGAPGTTVHSGLTDVTADQHHAQNHAARHVSGQPDALTAANIGAAPTSHSHVDGDIPASIARDSEVTTAVTNHEAAANPHSTYETSAEAQAKVDAHAAAGNPHPGYATDGDLTTHAGTPHGGSIDWGEVGDIVASAFADTAAAGALDEAARADHRHSREANPLTAHEGAADPHAGYLKESDVQGSGGASAFGDTAAAGAAATASRTDHRHSREANPVTAHEALADPHPGYLTPTEGNTAYQPLDSDLTALAAVSTTAFGRGLTALVDTAALAANHTHGGGGGNDPRITTRVLTANQADITGITLVELASLSVASLAAGTYQFVYRVIYQTTATTTGVEFVVDHSGTLTEFVSNAYFGSTGGVAATGIADQIGVGTAAGLMEVKTARVKNTRPGVTIGVDTANANMLMTVEGVFVASTSGNVRLLMAAELAALVVRAMRGSSLVLTKVD